MYADEKEYFGGQGDFVTVRHLTLRGTNREIGRKLTELVAQRYGKCASDFEADPLFAMARRTYLQRNYPIQWERACGAADEFGLDPDDDRYDVTALMYNVDLATVTPGCSVVYYPPSCMVHGGGFLSRNYDFSIGTINEVMHTPLPVGDTRLRVPVMAEPYVMEWYPQDGGYSSLAIHAFDILSGTLDGINSTGLVVSILADEEAIGQLGAGLEVHPGSPRATGLHELQVMRLLLDTCATAGEAKEQLLTIKQYYAFVPCHYIVADRAGNSFIYENSTGRNVQHVIDGNDQPQIVTNFQVHKHPTLDQMPKGGLSLETNAFWRYRTLADRIDGRKGAFTTEDLKINNASVNISRMLDVMRSDPGSLSIAANLQARTLWHSLYDQDHRTVETSFYLGEETWPDGTRHERRSDYIAFGLRD